MLSRVAMVGQMSLDGLGAEDGVYYEDGSGNVCQISKDAEVPTSHPAWGALQAHHKTKWASYCVKSAWHKEIRRSDHLRGMMLATAVRRLKGDAEVRNYVQSVIYEETRNVGLAHRMNESKMRGLDAASEIHRSYKTWENPGFAATYAEFLRALHAATEAHEPGRLPVENMRSAFMSGGLFDRYYALWRARLEWSHGDQRIMDLTAELGTQAGGWAERALVGPRHYRPETVIEIVCGAWSPECNRLRDPEPMPPVAYMPRFMPYAFDLHTRQGSAAYNRHVKDLRPGEPQPGGIDVRWSALARGELWRVLGFDQFGLEYRNRSWEDVTFPRDLWKWACVLDRYFYPKLRA